MRNKTTIKICSILSTLPILFVSCQVLAKPWLDAGDMKLRHELQLLSDAGLLEAPLTTWPLSSKDINDRLTVPSTESSIQPQLRDVLKSIKNRLTKEDYNSSFEVTGDARTKTLLIRDFSGEGREKYSVSYDGEWGSPYADLRLKATLADGTNHPDDSDFRLDESERCWNYQA